ncbi:hypothetical protein B0H12DRAFT_1236975 [Mycena haematopus]|nr:hypothetical protein B0H12DRAFT_1236975 [Mycena haematopus]
MWFQAAGPTGRICNSGGAAGATATVGVATAPTELRKIRLGDFESYARSTASSALAAGIAFASASSGTYSPSKHSSSSPEASDRPENAVRGVAKDGGVKRAETDWVAELQRPNRLVFPPGASPSKPPSDTVPVSSPSVSSLAHLQHLIRRLPIVDYIRLSIVGAFRFVATRPTSTKTISTVLQCTRSIAANSHFRDEGQATMNTARPADSTPATSPARALNPTGTTPTSTFSPHITSSGMDVKRGGPSSLSFGSGPGAVLPESMPTDCRRDSNTAPFVHARSLAFVSTMRLCCPTSYSRARDGTQRILECRKTVQDTQQLSEAHHLRRLVSPSCSAVSPILLNASSTFLPPRAPPDSSSKPRNTAFCTSALMSGLVLAFSADASAEPDFPRTRATVPSTRARDYSCCPSLPRTRASATPPIPVASAVAPAPRFDALFARDPPAPRTAVRGALHLFAASHVFGLSNVLLTSAYNIMGRIRRGAMARHAFWNAAKYAAFRSSPSAAARPALALVSPSCSAVSPILLNAS